MRPEISAILSQVRKPFRLVGGEVGSCVKDWDKAAVRICLAFPDVYEIGMSNVGLAILYDVINSHDEFLAERAFAPWGDVEEELRRKQIPLFSLESQRSLNEFNVVGISLPYELTYTNILMMLELAGIPLRSVERGEDHPLIIAGGPCAFNPEPVADFFDAIVLGDGENAIIKIANAVEDYKSGGLTKDNLLARLSKTKGVYVPRLFNAGVRKSIVPDLDLSPFPWGPIVAHAAVQDRTGIEVQRGCVRGCRFCQAGMIYRPVRQRSPHRVQDIALCQLQESGHADLSFLSLSVGDYSCLEEVLREVGSAQKQSHLNISLPSLRTESLTDEILERLGSDRAGSFTLAPEAATERMRNFINKGNTDEDLYASVEKVFQNGWSKIKLYFMVGLPGESEEETEGIVRMANRCLDIGRKYHRRPEIIVSTSTFVPKPHTPLQWSSQIEIEDALRIQKQLKKELRRPGIYYRWHNANMSFLEGVFSRGGTELSQAIELAYRSGARFDGWDECFDMERWWKAFSDCGIETQTYMDEKEKDYDFPWNHLYIDLRRDFLWREYEKAQRGEFTPSCVEGACQKCGVCNFDSVKNRIYSKMLHRGAVGTSSKVILDRRRSARGQSPMEHFKVRILFSKLDRAAYLGNLELMDAMRRTVRRAGLPICYSQGFHPRPKISLGPALSVGIESLCEFCDLELDGELTSEDILSRLNQAAPEGIKFRQAFPLGETERSIGESVAASIYEVELPSGCDVEGAIESFQAATNVPFTLTKKGKEKTVNLKEVVTELAEKSDSVVGLTIFHGGSSVRVAEAIKAIFGLEEGIRIRKIEVTYGQ